MFCIHTIHPRFIAIGCTPQHFSPLCRSSAGTSHRIRSAWHPTRLEHDRPFRRIPADGRAEPSPILSAGGKVPKVPHQNKKNILYEYTIYVVEIDPGNSKKIEKWNLPTIVVKSL